MAKNKSSSNSPGCETIIAVILMIGIVVAFMSAVFNILSYVLIGAMTCLPFILIILIACFIWKVLFYLTHRKPLTYEQAHALARKNAREYIKRRYKFKKGPVNVDPNFKSTLNSTGKWYEIEEPLDTFPAYIAALLKGKHHEWVVIAIEKDGLVCSMWANKGEDNQSVSFNCNISDIIQKCRQVGGYTVIRLHNHPNPDPRHYTTLLASEQDKISAKSCAEYVCKEGFNWYDFVCARGDFIQFYAQISDTFEVRGGSTSDIIDKIGICPKMDYRFQKEFRKVRGVGSVLKKKPVILTMFIAAAVLFYIVGKDYNNTPNVSNNNSENTAITITDISEDSSYNLPDEALTSNSGQVMQSAEWITVELEDFEYSYENDGIVLGEYKGSSTNVIIPASFEVEGTTLPVLKLDDTFERDDQVENIIISEGVTALSSGVFYNCSKIKHVYIPASVTSLSYSIKNIVGEVLYYGGTEEQWGEIKSVLWSDIEFKRVIFDSTVEDCYANKDTFIEDVHNTIESGYAPLTDFEYDLISEGIVLTDYSGDDESVKIAASYYVNGKAYAVVKLDTTFALSSVDIVCIPEGVTVLTQATFNSCGIKKLYLPSTLTDVPERFWRYFHDLDTLYYGGTEDEFKSLLGSSQNRWDLDIKHMEYEASPDDVFS